MSNECTPNGFGRALPALIMAAAAAVAGTQPAAAQTYCKIETVQTMSSVTDLCDCDIVTPGMLKHILGRSDFSVILEETSQECPRFARALTDFPVASFTPAPNEGGGGEGDRRRSDRGGNGPGGNGDTDVGETENDEAGDGGTEPGAPDETAESELNDARPS